MLVGTGTYRSLFTRVIYTEWIFFALMAVGLYAARRRPGYAPTYRVPGYPVVPGLFALAAVTVALDQAASDWRNGLIGLLLVIAGLPVYVLGRSRRRPPGQERAGER